MKNNGKIVMSCRLSNPRLENQDALEFSKDSYYEEDDSSESGPKSNQNNYKEKPGGLFADGDASDSSSISNSS